MVAERRQLTILNCDMIGSTKLSEELDPEVFEVIIQSFIDLSVVVIERNNGVFAINTGDGYEAYFYSGTGTPSTVYAIECGLDIHRSLKAHTAKNNHPISVRVGISTGQVVLSPHKIGSNTEADIAFGRPVSLAARLQSAAESDAVYVDESTRQSAEPYFNFIQVGEKILKGIHQPVIVWKVDSHRQTQSRFETHISKLSPLVGRSEELHKLQNFWDLSTEGTGQSVVIIGEPGIGKSRLVYEACKKIDFQSIDLQCLEHHENTPLHPWTRLFESVSNVNPRESTESRLEKLESGIGKFLPLNTEHTQTLLSVMVQSSSGNEEVEGLASQKLTELCAAIVDGIQKLADDSPQLVVIEDVHWIDPTTKTLVSMLLETIESKKIFVLATSRSGYQEYLDSTRFEQMHLDRLSHDQTIELAMTEIEGVLTDRIDAIVRWADGIPLFIEEIAKGAVNDDILGIQKHAEVQSSRGISSIVPISLQELLLARLDRLGTAKQVAQVASIIGRDFDLETLSLLREQPRETLEHDLEVLVSEGILLADSLRSERYTFKHALIHDVVTRNLLDRDAIALHRQLSAIYISDFPQMENSQAQEIAYHLSCAREWIEATKYWLKAGQNAKNTGSHLEAIGCLESGLEAVKNLDDSIESLQIKAHLQLILGQAISAHYGPINTGGYAAFESAIEIGKKIDDSNSVVSALTYLMWLNFDAGQFEVTLTTAAKLTDFAQKAGNYQAAALGFLGIGMCQFGMGHFVSARESLEKSISFLKFTFEQVEGYPGKSYTYIGIISHILGDPAEAFRLCKYSIELNEDRGVYDLAAALGNSLYLNVLQHDLDEMEATSVRLIELANKAGYVKWYHQGAFFLGSVQAARGDVMGLEKMNEAISRFEKSEELVELSIFYGLLADRYLIFGEVEQAIHWVDKGLDLAKVYGERFVEAPLLRLKARCLLIKKTDEVSEASAMLTSANEIAIEQGALAWQRSEQDVDTINSNSDSDAHFPF